MKFSKRMWQALDERLCFSKLSYPIPKNGNNLGYCLGGITLFSFFILIITGIYLAQFYSPEIAAANSSVLLMSAGFTGFIRGIHYWAAQAVFVLIILHLSRIYITGSYKKPREFNWLVGVGLFAITLGFIFSGTILKWDQEAYEAFLHNIGLANLLGSLGTWFSAAFSSHILHRMYDIHIAILPLLFVLVFLIHAFLVKMLGISLWPANGENTKHDTTIPFTTHMKKVTILGLIVLGALAVLSAVFPPPLGPAPIEGIEVTKPPWMFLGLYAIENSLGLKSLFYVPVLSFALLAAVPFVDMRPERNPSKRKLMIAALIVAMAILISLILMAALTAPQAHIG